MKIEYSSNNSGGRWWLKDKDWKALEKAGWYVIWGNLYFCSGRHSWNQRPENKPDCGEGDKCKGHRKFDSWEEMTDVDKWLGALAQNASKDFEIVKDAITEFEAVTGQSASDEGCNCCGAPHSFSWDGGYASGEDCLQYLYENVPSSLREAAELLNKKK